MALSAQDPQLPTSGDSPEQQRLFSKLGELVRTLVASGMFLLRPQPGPVVRRQVTGSPLNVLRWGELGRIDLSGALTVQLPRIDPAHVGTPLYFAKRTDTGAATFVASGLGVDGKRRPLINGASSLAITSAGLYVAIPDGLDWYVVAASGGDVSGLLTLIDEAAHFPIMVISAASTTLDAAHFGKHLVFTHATPTLTVDSGLTAGKLVVGLATQGPLTFVEGTATIHHSNLWSLATTGAYAPFSLKVYDTDEVFLAGELEDA